MDNTDDIKNWMTELANNIRDIPDPSKPEKAKKAHRKNKNNKNKKKGSIFNLTLEHKRHLKDGPVDDSMRKLFNDHKLSLSSKAKITEEGDKEWNIEDGSKIYNIKEEDEKLEVYKKRKPKKLRPAAAFLRALGAIPIIKVAKVLTRFISPKHIKENDKKAFSGRGPPHHPLDAVFMAASLLPIKNKRSINELVAELTSNPGIAHILGLHMPKNDPGEKGIIGTNKTKEKQIGCGSMFTHYVKRTGWKVHAKQFGQFARMLHEKGGFSGECVIFDSEPISACDMCRHYNQCSYLRGKKNKDGYPIFPKNCLKNHLEWAKPFYKESGKRCVGAKKHTAIDLNLETGELTTIAEFTTPGDISDTALGVGLMNEVKKIGVHPKYVILDGAYNDDDIHKHAMTKMKCKVATRFNRRNEKRASITFLDDEGRKITVTTKGTPICDAGIKMRYNSYDPDKKVHEWVCKLDCDKGGNCLLGRKGCVTRICLDDGSMKETIKDPFRRFPDPPYETKEHDEIYVLRKLGEQPYSQFNQNLPIPKWVKTTDALQCWVYIADSIPLMLSLIAIILGVKGVIHERDISALIHHILTLFDTLFSSMLPSDEQGVANRLSVEYSSDESLPESHPRNPLRGLVESPILNIKQLVSNCGLSELFTQSMRVNTTLKV
jgi:hypothetical protein